MTKILESLGFRDNPFASYSAENEPQIDQYFVRPPYYEFVRERGMTGRSVILFGARGAGKSATRLAFSKDAWNTPAETRPLIVTLDDFSRVLPEKIDDINLEGFVGEIGYLVIEALLLWLVTQPEEEQEFVLGSLTDQENDSLITLVQRFYLVRPAYIRHASVQEPLKLLRQAWHERAKLWVGQKWDSVASLIATAAEAIASRAAKVPLPISGPLSALLKADSKQWNDAQFARVLLLRFTELVRVFGFSGISILVDKVDETEPTNNSSRSTARLLYPILANTQLLEISGFAWLFFLWDKVRDEYSTDALPVRLDKIANATISWEEGFLRNLIQKRLVHYSSATINGFSALCDPTVNADDVLTQIVQMSTRSPRELIRLLDTIVREHDDEYASSEAPPRLLQSTIGRGMDKYAIEALRRTFDRQSLQQASRLSLLPFINKDVQQIFRINASVARSRILQWVDAGIVAQTGTRAAEGGGVGKPSYEYSVSDLRVKRMIERHLTLGADFEVGNELDEDAE